MKRHQRNRSGKNRYTMGALILICSQFMSGCHVMSNNPAKSVFSPSATMYSEPVKPELANEDKTAAPAGQASTCQRELSSLSGINPRDYADKRADFNALLQSANAYKDVRQQISPGMRETMDSFYKFKMLRLCSQIELSLQQGLIAIEDKHSEIK